MNKKLFVFGILIFLTNYFFGESFHQTLQWKGDENALEYKIEVRQQGTEESDFYETEQNSVSLTLSSGDYEYRVYAYDVLGRESSVSEWCKFTILKAVTPDVSVTEQTELALKKHIKLSVDIKDIEKDSVVELVDTRTNNTVKGKLKSTKSDGKLIATTASFPEITEGEWIIRVTNPCGLSSESEVISIQDKKDVESKQSSGRKKIDLNFQAGIGDLISLYDNQLLEYNDYTSLPFIPEIRADVSYFPIKTETWRFGFEVNGMLTNIKNTTELYSLEIPMGIIGCDFDIQRKIITEHLYFGIKLGGGVVLISPRVSYDEKYEQSNLDSENSIYGCLCVKSGVSLFWIPFKSIVFELGADFRHIFIPNTPFGMISPYLTIGYRF